MDQTPLHHPAPEPASGTLGWAGVYAAFTVLATAAILSMFAWSQFYPATAAFVSTIGAGIAVAYLATAYLLSNRLVISRSPALVLLASAYVVCGLAVGLYTITYPGVAPEWWPFGPIASRWFWVVWHGAAAIGIIGFVALDDEWMNRSPFDIPDASARDVVTRVFLRDAGAFMRGPFALAFTFVAGSAVWLWRDPSRFEAWFGGAALPPGFVAILLFLGLTAIGLLAAALRRDHIVRAWLVLASVASLLDVAAVSWSNGPSTIGWYFSQACGLVAAVVLPLVLFGDLRHRLVAGDSRSMLDPLLMDAETGFANEQGLTIQLGRLARLAILGAQPLTVAVVEVDDAIVAAPLLRRLFRTSDVIGRTGDKEFGVILTPGSKANTHWLQRRLAAGETVRVGITRLDPSGPRSIGDLLGDALRDARANVVELTSTTPNLRKLA